MNTACIIAKEDSNGIKAILCNHDGYVNIVGNVLQTLKESEVDTLMKLPTMEIAYILFEKEALGVVGKNQQYYTKQDILKVNKKVAVIKSKKPPRRNKCVIFKNRDDLVSNSVDLGECCNIFIYTKAKKWEVFSFNTLKFVSLRNGITQSLVQKHYEVYKEENDRRTCTKIQILGKFKDNQDNEQITYTDVHGTNTISFKELKLNWLREQVSFSNPSFFRNYFLSGHTFED